MSIYHRIKNRSDCLACQGSGTSYWGDDIDGSCLECCCINCEKFYDLCKCKFCKKCDSFYWKGKCECKHLCMKCNKYKEKIWFVLFNKNPSEEENIFNDEPKHNYLCDTCGSNEIIEILHNSPS